MSRKMAVLRMVKFGHCFSWNRFLLSGPRMRLFEGVGLVNYSIDVSYPLHIAIIGSGISVKWVLF